MMILLPDSEWHANGSEELLCRLPFGVAEVEARFGIRFTALAQGAPRHAVVQLDGDVLRLEVRAPDGRVMVSVRGDVQAPGHCLPVVCAALGIEAAQLPWVSDDLPAKPWLLTRLDDNGNRVAMWYFRERETAEAVARDYAARGHKQTYEVENVS